MIGFHYFLKGREFEHLLLFILHKQLVNYSFSRDTERREERRVLLFLEQDCEIHPSKAPHTAGFFTSVRKGEEKQIMLSLFCFSFLSFAL